MSNTHKIYAAVIAAIIVIAVVVGGAWSEHVRDEAKRDAVIDAQRDNIAALDKKIEADAKASQERIAQLELQKQDLAKHPEQAPQIIRELIPTLQATPSAPAPAAPVPTASTTPLPDTPQPQGDMCLSPSDQVKLAQFGIACQQTKEEHDQLAQKVTDQEDIIGRQKTQLDAAVKAAKGGSVWQRTKRIAKWGAIVAGAGYAIGRSQR